MNTPLTAKVTSCKLLNYFLGVAIVAEVLATTLLKTSEGFTRGWPSVATVLVFGVSFWCLAQTLGTVSTGVAYAI